MTIKISAQAAEIILLIRGKDFSPIALRSIFLAALNVKGCLITIEKAAIRKRAKHPINPQQFTKKSTLNMNV